MHTARLIHTSDLDAETLQHARELLVEAYGGTFTDADWERISSTTAVFDMLTGACFSYNYAEGKYQLNYSLLAGLGSLLLGLTLMGAGAWMYQRKMANRGKFHA